MGQPVFPVFDLSPKGENMHLPMLLLADTQTRSSVSLIQRSLRTAFESNAEKVQKQ